MLKKMASIVMVTILSFSVLSGCGSKAAPSSSKTEATNAEETKSEESKTAVASDGKEIIINFSTIWVGKDSKAPVIKEIVDKFNADNAGKIKVVVEEMSDYQAYRDKIRTSITTGMPPDVFSVDFNLELETFYSSGKLMDLTKYMEDGWKDDFLPDPMKYAKTADGKYMAIAYEFATTPILYNSKILTENGYDAFPKTYSEMIDMFKVLKEKGIISAPMMTGENAYTTMLWYSQLCVAHGGPDIWSKKDLDDPAFVKAAKDLREMFDYSNADAIGAGAAISAGHFLNERSATLINGPWFIGRLKKEGINNMYESVNVSAFPTVESGLGKEGGYVGFIQSLLAAAKQDDPAKEEAVVKFLKALCDPENVKKLSLASGAMFCVNFELGAGETQERIHAEMVKQRDAAPYVVPHIQAVVNPGIASELPQAFSGLFTDELTPEEFVEHLKSSAQ